MEDDNLKKQEELEEKKNSEDLLEEVKKETEKMIKILLQEGMNNQDNLDNMYKFIDIHKDICNENYWKIKEEEIMRYRDYGEYNDYGDGAYGRRGVAGTGRSRYSDGAYGRRGVKGTGRGRYRGEAMLEEMMEEYGNYSEGREMYGADQDTLKSFKYMLKSFKDYYKHLKEEASSQEEIQLLEQTAREMLEM